LNDVAASPEKAATADLQVGEWRFSRRGNELRRGGEVVRLEPKAAEVLAFVAARRNEVVTREELFAAVWPGVIVGDDTLTQAIIKLRKALGDDAQRPAYIETISKRGYRLIASVGPVAAEGQASPRQGPLAATVPGLATRLRSAPVVASVALAVVAAALVIGGGVKMPWPLSLDRREAVTAAMPVVAVLPLANLSGDPARDYFSDGVTEDLINALGRFSGLRVMSRNAVEAYKGKPQSPRVIRDELGARYVVSGSVRQQEGRLRVTVELSDTDRGTLLASEEHEGSGTQLFEIQDRVVRNIVGALHIKLRAIEEERVFGRPAQTLEVNDLVLRARALLRQPDRGSNREARALLARARQMAPDYAEVYTDLGAAEFQRVTEGYVEDARDGLRRAEDHLKRALASPDARAHVRAHSHLAALYSHQGRIDEALEHARKAVELNPSDAHALYWEGAALLFAGRIDEAIRVLETARRYEPGPSVGRGINLALAYFIVGRSKDALAQADGLLVRAPRNAVLHAMRAAALAQLGDLEAARRAADEVRRFDPLFDPDNFGARFSDPKYTGQLREGLRMAGL
jgi:TolB-like protein/DNA-binding winged helix-turn-helix (wHTH) protein/Flp pilus assembly protein TadD